MWPYGRLYVVAAPLGPLPEAERGTCAFFHVVNMVCYTRGS